MILSFFLSCNSMPSTLFFENISRKTTCLKIDMKIGLWLICLAFCLKYVINIEIPSCIFAFWTLYLELQSLFIVSMKSLFRLKKNYRNTIKVSTYTCVGTTVLYWPTKPTFPSPCVGLCSFYTLVFFMVSICLQFMCAFMKKEICNERCYSAT